MGVVLTDYPLREGFVSVEGMRLQYVEAGPSDGPPLLFLHGIGGGIEDWWANLGYFGEQGYRVLAPSMPGHGESEYQRDKWDPADSGKTVISLMDAWGIEAAPLIGHSAGGIAVLLAALEAPERVTALALVATGGLSRKVGWPLKLLTIPLIGEAMWQPWVLAGSRASKAIFADPEMVNVAIMEQWVSRHRHPKQRRAFFHLLRKGMDLRGLKRGYDLRERIRDIECPVLVFWGREDVMVPAPERRDGRLLAWPEAEFMELSPCGHWPQVEQAGVFNEKAAGFLGGVAAIAGRDGFRPSPE